MEKEKIVYMARVLSTDVSFDSKEERDKFLEGFKVDDVEAIWRREMIWEDFYECIRG